MMKKFSSLTPKDVTQAAAWCRAFPAFDGSGVTVAVLDTGVDPSAAGLQVTPDGRPKVIDLVDATGAGDVDTRTLASHVRPPASPGEPTQVLGLSGRLLKLNPAWVNPTGAWRLGLKAGFELYPKSLKTRVTGASARGRDFGEAAAALLLAAQDALDAAKRSTATSSSSAASPGVPELEARVAALKDLIATAGSEDPGPVYDVIAWHDGTRWRAAVDTSLAGDLTASPALTDFKVERQWDVLDRTSLLAYAINIYSDGDVVSIVTDAGAHGTHVAGIIGAYHPHHPDMNGVAPGVQIVGIKIGDARLGSMETGTGLVRGVKAVLDAGAHVVNMSYGESSRQPSSQAGGGAAGRFIELATSLVHEHGVIFVSSAGNAGPALSTVGAPGGTHSHIISVGAAIHQPMMDDLYALRRHYRAPGGGGAGAGGEVLLADSAALVAGDGLEGGGSSDGDLAGAAPRTPGGASRRPGAGDATAQSAPSASASDRTADTSYTWSSRGPTADGFLGVSVCAPGGAITCVPSWCLDVAQLMNGTSMASPCAAGCISLMLSGLRAQGMPWTPWGVRAAIENTAAELGGQTEVFGTGHGLIQTFDAYRHLVLQYAVALTKAGQVLSGRRHAWPFHQRGLPNPVGGPCTPPALPSSSSSSSSSSPAPAGGAEAKEEDEEDDGALARELPTHLLPYIQVGVPGGGAGGGEAHDRGVYIRDAAQARAGGVYNVQLTPVWKAGSPSETRVAFHARLELAATDPRWVSAPSHIFMGASARGFGVHLDTAALAPGHVHFAEVVGLELLDAATEAVVARQVWPALVETQRSIQAAQVKAAAAGRRGGATSTAAASASASTGSAWSTRGGGDDSDGSAAAEGLFPFPEELPPPRVAAAVVSAAGLAAGPVAQALGPLVRVPITAVKPETPVLTAPAADGSGGGCVYRFVGAPEGSAAASAASGTATLAASLLPLGGAKGAKLPPPTPASPAASLVPGPATLAPAAGLAASATASSTTLSPVPLFLRAGAIHRRFLAVPPGATWAEITLTRVDDGTLGAASPGAVDTAARMLVIHALQVWRGGSNKLDSHEEYFSLRPGGDKGVLAMPVTPGHTLEVVAAQFWSSLGSTLADVSVAFHGVRVSPDPIVFGPGTAALHVVATPELGDVQLKPLVRLSHVAATLQPLAVTALPPLLKGAGIGVVKQLAADRDTLVNGKRQHSLTLAYRLVVPEGAGALPLRLATDRLHGILYESPFEAQLYSVVSARTGAVHYTGDAFDVTPGALPVGRYWVLLNVRHEDAGKLEALTGAGALPLTAEWELGKNDLVSLKVTVTRGAAVAAPGGGGGDGTAGGPLRRGQPAGVYIAAPAASALPKWVKALPAGTDVSLTGYALLEEALGVQHVVSAATPAHRKPLPHAGAGRHPTGVPVAVHLPSSTATGAVEEPAAAGAAPAADLLAPPAKLGLAGGVAAEERPLREAALAAAIAALRGLNPLEGVGDSSEEPGAGAGEAPAPAPDGEGEAAAAPAPATAPAPAATAARAASFVSLLSSLPQTTPPSAPPLPFEALVPGAPSNAYHQLLAAIWGAIALAPPPAPAAGAVAAAAPRLAADVAHVVTHFRYLRLLDVAAAEAADKAAAAASPSTTAAAAALVASPDVADALLLQLGRQATNAAGAAEGKATWEAVKAMLVDAAWRAATAGGALAMTNALAAEGAGLLGGTVAGATPAGVAFLPSKPLSARPAPAPALAPLPAPAPGPAREAALAALAAWQDPAAAPAAGSAPFSLLTIESELAAGKLAAALVLVNKLLAASAGSAATEPKAGVVGVGAAGASAGFTGAALRSVAAARQPLLALRTALLHRLGWDALALRLWEKELATGSSHTAALAATGWSL